MCTPHRASYERKQKHTMLEFRFAILQHNCSTSTIHSNGNIFGAALFIHSIHADQCCRYAIRFVIQFIANSDIKSMQNDKNAFNQFHISIISSAVMVGALIATMAQPKTHREMKNNR